MLEILPAQYPPVREPFDCTGIEDGELEEQLIYVTVRGKLRTRLDLPRILYGALSEFLLCLNTL